MGYTTEFEGTLRFKKELKASEIAHLNKFLGKDRRDIGFSEDVLAFMKDDDYWYHIDLKLTDDFSGIFWDGSEKTYCMDSIINFLTREMRKIMPDFELVGKLKAQGEDALDEYEIIMEGGVAKINKLKIVGEKITCPNCDKEFIKEEKE